MLNFIVLGLVPGTQFQITFGWILAVLAVAMLYIELRYRRYLRLLTTAQTLSLGEPVQMSLPLPAPKIYTLEYTLDGREYAFSIEL